jgi:hypothetical protein
MIHWPSSSRPCGSFRISRWPKVTRPGAGLLRVLEGGTAPAQRALRLSPHDPLAAVYCGTASYAQFVGHNYDEAMRLARPAARRFRWRASGINCRRRHGRSVTSALPRPGCRSCGAHSPIFRSAGSPSKCQSNTRPSGSAIWKDSAAPVWTNAAQLGLPVCRFS